LDLHAVAIAGEEMPAAKELLERAQEHLDHPPQSIHLRDAFGRQVESIGDKPQHAVTVRALQSSVARVRCLTFQPRSTISSLMTLAARSASVNSFTCVTVARVLSDDLQTYLLPAALIAFQSL
jgi:hypothetical protein